MSDAPSRDRLLGVWLLIVAVVLGLVFDVVRQVFAVALYRYAVDGTVLGGFPREDLERPFEARRRWRRG